jgi:hypothetical protein
MATRWRERCAPIRRSPVSRSSRSPGDDVTKAREAGFGGHLAKPPSPEAIMMMLRDARS